MEGRRNFGDKAVITPLPAIIIATWDDQENPDVDAPVINEYKLTLECQVVTFDEDGRGGARVVGEKVGTAWGAGEAIQGREAK